MYTVQMVSTTPYSRLHPWNSSHCGNTGQNLHSKERVVDEEPLTAWVQLMDQPTVTSFWWPPPRGREWGYLDKGLPLPVGGLFPVLYPYSKWSQCQVWPIVVMWVQMFTRAWKECPSRDCILETVISWCNSALRAQTAVSKYCFLFK